MFLFDQIAYDNKAEFYDNLTSYVESIVHGETDLIANLANASSLLFIMMSDVNWAGFYLYKEEQLVLGPFQGNPACIRIPMGKGVCGTAASKRETQLVEDVALFQGHIPCDGDTKSEIVVPLIKHGRLIGVLDLDSPIIERFTHEDQKYLEAIVIIIMKACELGEAY
ncbi:MAG: GAF domain-containing protein [Vallitaleaceae bacterium]|nr:GAF domain-containing protein [Vallitaleaceae bacterium]